ncbi:MAG: hypothetical protein A3J58_01085 [Candidatus Sungbacteria bacterium RIFCSPHIGHO2_02_FULL_52_23]|uniref:Uncharacterized protein n=1 Tax=Candidatus Sungbacteria bacterium RIFCSPHIGHO2_02_FULL_52_23 TaxID=1802274 RepID=A0A1G2KXR2_9BACT|nr:MAG: hypothetical protein A3J58_01085 [Candidatus Sungbacteria bacterium RIFCSPHIGHO2_02_FULL_52_23]
MTTYVPAIAQVSEDSPITKQYFDRVQRALTVAAKTGTHMDVFTMLMEGHKTLVYHAVGWELKRVMDETGEVNKNLWEVFVASVEYMLDRDGLEAYARPFRRAGGGDLLRWMRRADTDDEKKLSSGLYFHASLLNARRESWWRKCE